MAKVVIVQCDTYEQERVDRAVETALETLSDGNPLYYAGRILLKPNLVTPSLPSQCVTTHPAVFTAVARYFKKYTSASLFYGDSPANVSLEVAAKRAGIYEAATKEKIEPAEFSTGVEAPFLAGRACTRFSIAKGAQEADSIISLPKFKTHTLTTITGAIKNQFGCIYKEKSHMHREYRKRDDFVHMLIDLNLYLKSKIKLFVMDAVYSMEGEGPYAGRPRSMGAILVSTDPVALDYVACLLVRAKPQFIRLLTAAEERGLGEYSKHLEIVCEHGLAGLMIDDFTLPKSTVFDKVAAIFKTDNRLRRPPSIDPTRCTGCAKCMQICPAAKGAIHKREDQNTYKIVAKNCIRCFCCHEICPAKAICV